MANGWGCHRCPHFMGCFPSCQFPSATWADNTTASKPPEWVLRHNAEMDRLAALLRAKEAEQPR